ncbi:hypothetical protein [Salmonella enterica]|uniref:hypothetical protein n=1 Tax=Salmonella enterica TaxID=28901 RepID=UPI00043753A8|nr:hypothetical protein [Salmonella enterica]EBM9045547.1 hypothetical protein [Salmonella enterica subsp. enterica serovar Schwarzengrund]EYI73344.1 hypothetical protein SEEH4388_20372 [Salmonella enterica subsp. enterica serovar Heidelberg str. CVM24388]
MNSSKHESTENSTPQSWQAATVDQAAVERIQNYEQQFREERAAKRAEREAREEEVTFTTEIDVTDPNRSAAPIDRPTVKREAVQLETEATELDAEAAELEAIDPAAGWEASEAQLEAAELDARAVQLEGMSEQAQAVEVSQDDPERAAARAEIERAFSGQEHDHGLER